jgi:hypothetical protein
MRMGRSRTAERGEREYIDEYVTLGEMAGRVPHSMMVNVNFEKYANESEVQLIGYEAPPK